MTHFPKVSGGATPGVSSSLQKVLEAAQREADTMRDEYVSSEHLLLALAKVIPLEACHDPWGPKIPRGEFVRLRKVMKEIGEI